MSKELAREKGIEGYIKKKYPDVYQLLKQESEKSGKPIIELLTEFANYGLSVKRYAGVLTEKDLENLDPKSLYVAIKLLNWASQQYFTTLAYSNIASIQTMHQLLMQMMSYYQGLYSEGEGEKMATPPLMLPPARADRISKLVDLVTEGIRAFNAMMYNQVTNQTPQPIQQPIPSSVAKKLVETAKKASEE